MSLKPPFYVVSDTHFGHQRICDYADRPYDHEVMMIKRWGRVVKDGDTVVHLGDLFFGGQAGYESFAENVAPKLTGRKYLILGNHDRKKWDYAALGFEVVKPFSFPYRGYTVTLSHYPKFLPEGERCIHVHGHIHNHGYAHGEMVRYGNVNVSVEVMDYRPHRITRLLNREILRRNGKKGRYTNSRHIRWQRRATQKRMPR